MRSNCFDVKTVVENRKSFSAIDIGKKIKAITIRSRCVCVYTFAIIKLFLSIWWTIYNFHYLIIWLFEFYIWNCASFAYFTLVRSLLRDMCLPLSNHLVTQKYNTNYKLHDYIFTFDMLHIICMSFQSIER